MSQDPRSEEQFDELSRALASNLSRRQLIKGLAGGALAAVLSLAGTRGASAQPGCRREGHPCEGNQVCCPGLVCTPAAGPGQAARCTRPTPNECKKDGGNCKDNKDCCDGYYCKDGCCRKKPECKKDGGNCKDNKDCCDGYYCKDGCCRKKVA